MKKITTTITGIGLAGVVALAGCSSSNDSSTENNETVEPQPTETSEVAEFTAEVPASVQGPEWCTEVYTVYTGGAESPVEAGEQMAAAAANASNEPSAQQAITALADFLKAQDPTSAQELSEEDYAKFNELDATVGEQFAEYCGGQTVMETIMAQYEENVGSAPEGATTEEEVVVEGPQEGEITVEEQTTTE